jgi:hypothetical protein
MQFYKILYDKTKPTNKDEFYYAIPKYVSSKYVPSKYVPSKYVPHRYGV